MTDSFDIAIVGMACNFPDAKTPEEFWQNLISGKESIKKFTHEELIKSGYKEEEINDPNFVGAKAVLDDYKSFDNNVFGYLKDEVDKMDPQCRLLHECCWHALEDAAYVPSHSRERIGLFAGAASNIPWISNLLKQKLTPAETFDIVNWNLPESIITRTAYRLGLNGPVMAIHTACSTSLVAIHTACQSILSGDCDLALAGGVSITLPQESGYLYQQGMVRSADGHCRPFDIDSNGTVGGSGAGILLLKPLDRALEDNDHIHAIIKGSAINNDGQRKVGFTAPSVEGQAEVISSAQMLAGVEAEDVSYIECHGTATEIGDPIEVSALSRVFRNSGNVCWLGAVKSNIGHLDEAAGVAGVIKTVMSLKHKQLAPTLHYHQPNDKLHIEETPFKVVDKLMDWSVPTNEKRIAGVSSFGIGGTNAHIVLAEADKQEALHEDEYPNVFLISAETPAALHHNQQNILTALRSSQKHRLCDIAYVLQEGRTHHRYRKAFVGSNIQEIGEALEKVTTNPTKAKDSERHIVFMLPGQGAQYTNMALSLYEKHAKFRSQVDHCLTIASRYLGEPLKEKWFNNGNVNYLSETQYAQPVIFIVEYALANCLIEAGIKPSALLGYSFGELVAATIAEVFTLEDALKFVVKRGQLMQSLPTGAMLSIPLPASEVLALCPSGIVVAVDNKDSCIVSSDEKSIEEFSQELKKKRILTTPIKSKHAAHSPAMAAINKQLLRILASFTLGEPKIPIISSVTGEELTAAESTSIQYWADQAEKTVCFIRGLENILNNKSCVFIEVGVGRDLVNLVRRYVPQEASQSIIQLLPEDNKAQTQPYLFWSGLGKIWQQGIQIQWRKVSTAQDYRRISLPGYAFEKSVFWPKNANFLRLFSGTQHVEKEKLCIKKNDNMSDWLYQAAWQQHILQSTKPEECTKSALIFKLGSSNEQSTLFEKALLNHYQKAVRVKVGSECELEIEALSTLRCLNYDDYKNLFDLLNNNEISIEEMVIDCINVDLSLNEQLAVVLYLLKSHRAFSSHPNLMNVTLLTQNGVVVCNEPDINPFAAAMMSISTVIRQEFHELCCKVIDVGALNDCSADKLIREIAERDNKNVVYRNNRRWAEVFLPYSPIMNDETSRLKKEGVYLLIGGRGFIGHTFAQYLATEYNANLIITSRSRQNIDDKWQQVSNDAANLEFAQVDASDRVAMDAFIQDTTAKYGRIDGVFYLAGLTGEASLRSINETETDYIDSHLISKQKGIEVLEQVLEPVNYDFCLILSSLAPILGGLGFFAYAAASSYLDAFVLRHNRQNDKKWTLINWDGWELAEKTELNAKIGSSLSHLLVTKEEGISLLEEVLKYQEKDAVVISTADINARIAQWSNPSLSKNEEGSDDSGYSARPDLDSEYVAPNSEIEKKLVSIWQEFLRIESIGMKDDFFDLGGNSLKAITLLSRIHKSCQIDVSLTHFFKNPTIKDIVALTDSQFGKSEYQAILLAEEQENYPLSPGQRRLYLQQILDKNSVAYNETAAFSISGKLDKDKFNKTLQSLVKRHDSLRTSFVLINGEPRQKCHQDLEINLEHVKLNSSGLSNEEIKSQVQSLIKPFNLNELPLMRPILIEVKEDQYIFFLDLHHIISDGLSQDIFVRDFLEIYQDKRLKPLDVQYKDYTVWQQNMANSCRIQKQQEFWISNLKQVSELQLPTDYPRTGSHSHKGQRIYFTINKKLSDRLDEFANRENITRFMLFISSYALFLKDISGQDAFAVGTPILGRPQSELQDIIGMFVNLLPITFKLDDDLSFKCFVNNVAENTIAAFENSDFQFEDMVKALNIKPRLNRTPIFDTVFSYMNIGMADFTLPDVKFSRYDISQESSRFDLAFFVKETETGYEFSFEYKSELFRDESIERFKNKYIALLEGIVSKPDDSIRLLLGKGEWDENNNLQKEELLDFNF
ncbi:SDR family NAD(P)-dependent oxidoreductase [Xenorhabdus bovienii]|uniref:type I polyketide synthase n=1 Tax=Xenorhabdus bovienii TaxID=40576 RepID=UPI0023B331F0|nr:type I polyketide synthase [Xenorhabdus bovienii]MDE9493590.1 SDR family NAD(P)-dependent oxidoreductase [Xenorhabdus bovienii]MDE9502127.1 SDR family NAD(P)-dependent oxidoreductase [Xenorhabdus bovienii]MDE9525978.1 SDR family NAD(P)-dependent oxidoreductase [Xenorhabdus bovienii]MDE9569417.1 SDR family NAD(P)-dependent oxidoreductase [Xenorhabdus bovienii]